MVKKYTKCSEVKPANGFHRGPRDTRAATKQRYRVRKLSLPDDYTADDWRDCKDYWGRRCANCGWKHRHLQQDHFIPISSEDCPGTVVENIVPLCPHCNRKKSSKNPLDFFEPPVLELILEYFDYALDEYGSNLE